MRNIKFLSHFFSIFLLCFVWSINAQKPNIVVIVTDDQGYADIDIDMLGFNSNPKSHLRAPRLKALAESSWFFKNAYTSGNICAPTRAGLMTGRYQARNGVFNGGDGDPGMPKDVLTIPRHLGNEYIKGAFGKWHSGECRLEQDPIARGFDEYIGYFAKGGHDYFKLRDDEYGSKKENFMMRGQNFIDVDDSDYPTHLQNGSQGVYMTELLTYEAVEFIKEHANKPTPFFCYLAYTALHSPAQAPTSDKEEFLDFNNGSTGNTTRDTLMAMLKILDTGIGEVIDTLKSEGVFNNTLLIFLTDNGGASSMQADMGSLLGNKQSNYQGGIKTPFILSWPSAYPTSGQVIEEPIISLDIFPTMLDAANIAEPTEVTLDGKSVLPLLTGSTNHHDALYWSEGAEKFDRFVFGTENPLGEFAIIDGDWKIFSDVNQSNLQINLELYNIKNDPNETTNRYSANKEGIALELLKKYETWLAEMADPIRAINAKSFYPPITNSDAAAVYNDVYFQGTKERIRNTGKYNTSALPFGDNGIRSIVVQRGYIVKLYENDNQTGASITVKGEGKPLFLNNLDKKISSIEVIKGYGPCNGNVSLSYSDSGTDRRRDPIRLLDHDYTNDSGRFLSRRNSARVNFEFCESVKLNGLGVFFKMVECGFDQFVDIELSNNGGSSWTKVVNDGEAIVGRSSATVFEFPEQSVTDMRLTFTAFENGSAQKPQILEVDIMYADSGDTDTDPDTDPDPDPDPDTGVTEDDNGVLSSSDALHVWRADGRVKMTCVDRIRLIEVYDLSGLRVFRKNVSDKYRTTFRETEINSGQLYLLTVTTSNGRQYNTTFGIR